MAKQTDSTILTGAINGDYDYYVKLPVSGYEAHVRGLLVREEAAIRSGQTKPSYIYETTIKTIYQCTKFKDITDENGQTKQVFPTLDSFMKGMCSADRDALLWAIINKSYGEDHDVTIICDSCKKRMDIPYNIPNSMEIIPYTGKEPLMEKNACLEIPEYGWKIYMKMPTLVDELKILNTNSSNKKMNDAYEFIMINKIEAKSRKNMINGKSETDIEVFENPLEIYGLIADKPVMLRKRILKFWEQEFGDYGVKVQFECICTDCRTNLRMAADPMSHMFQLLF